MKFVLIVLVNWVLITIVGVTSESDSTPFPTQEECLDFTCDSGSGDDCTDDSSFFDNVTQCDSYTGFCYLARARTGAGTFVYIGTCDDSLCTQLINDDSDPDNIHRCCEGLFCNGDTSVFPTACDSATLPTIANGNYSATNSGDTATAVCDSGYKLTGSNTVECQQDETWTAAGATCVRKNCDAALFPELGNGTFSAGTKYVGDTATASCNTGYELSGSDTIICEATEEWSTSTAVCDRIHCEQDPLPIKIVNGSYDAPANSRNMGDQATLTCDTGYYINGSAVIECQADRTWSQPDATCEIATDCSHDPLPSFNNGEYTATSSAFGDEATAKCSSGHEFDNGSPASITCQTDGTWETPTTLPSCTKSVSADGDSKGVTGKIAGGVTGGVFGAASLTVGSLLVRRMLQRNNNQVKPLG